MRNLLYYRRIFSNNIETIAVAATIVLALCSTFAIAANKLLLPFAFVGLILYISFPLRIKMFLLALGSLYPISFGALGPIPHFYWVEWMAPLLAILYILWFLSKSKNLFVRGNFWPYSAFLALITTSVVNYARNPVLAEKLMGVGEETGGIRSYYYIFVGMCLFFVILWYIVYFVKNSKHINTFLAVTAVFSIGIGFLQLAAFFYNFQLPFLFSVFRFEHKIFDPALYGGFALRIGGLSECAVIGLSAVLALSYGRKLSLKAIIAICLCAALLVLSGGRIHVGGALIAIGVYMGLSGARRAMAYIIVGTLLIYVFGLLASSGYLGGQWERYATIAEGYDAIDRARDTTYQMMLDTIKNQPFFGKGIGYAGTGGGGTHTSQFALHQLKTGGHGAYLSTLSIFGIFGLYFLLATITYGVIKGLSLVRRSLSGTSSLAMFCLLLLIISAISYVTGGNGYSDMRLYFCVAILAGLSRKGFSLGYEK